MKRYRIAIIGGGAAGLVCALTLLRGGERDVVLLEKNDRVGKKLSQTGNGQGNLTNVDMGVRHYFSSDLSIVSKVLEQFSEKDTEALFSSLGALTVADERGRVYPSSRQASSLTDLLRFELERLGARLEIGREVVHLERGFVLTLSDGERLGADFVVQCTGGKAAKQFGTDGSAYALAKGLGHSLTPLFPALVQCRADVGALRSLKGIRSDVVLRCGDVAVRGDFMIADYGITGDAVFRLSSYLADRGETTVYVEFLPDVSEETLLSLLKGKRAPQGELFCGVLNNQIGRYLCKAGGSIEGAVRLCKRFPVRVLGTLDFSHAQVTRGGVPMNEVTEKLESRKCGGYFLCGEILDVDGECGGYNLQWAFASGAIVAKELLCRR